MDKKIIFTVGAFSLIILILGYIIFGSQNKKNTQIKIPSRETNVYYYGETCPHCKDVQKWMNENKVEQKIKIEKKEVWNNQKNAQELNKVAENCGLNISSIGVPFLYSDGKCFIGTPDVIKQIENKIKNFNNNQQK
ncbi:MAG: hypothetical protein N2593_02225 [Patescibacteria group bacterium]|nr:hypothetical protein [Patescibacteria group bacterium]MCX7955904.1 hypothetical protein [Patescibacteria group bacterium]